MMRSKTLVHLSALFALLALTACASGRADYYEQGHAAYKRGDYAVAVKEWRTGAERGDAKSQYELGLSYEKGEGLPQSDIDAVTWYRKSAEQGMAAGQNGLGGMYLRGRGVPQDEKMAVKLFFKAAEQGLHDAIFNLARCYEMGRGVPQDYNVAALMYLEAALRGYAPAQANVGLLYAKGVPDVPQDNALAYKWLSLAIPNLTGDTQARIIKSRDTVAARLTSVERQKMDQIMREWKPKTKNATASKEPKGVRSCNDTLALLRCGFQAQ